MRFCEELVFVSDFIFFFQCCRWAENEINRIKIVYPKHVRICGVLCHVISTSMIRIVIPHHLLYYKVQVFIPALVTVKQNSASSASFIFALLLSFWWQFGHNRVHNITIEKQRAFCTCRLHLMFVLQEQTLLYL